MTPMWIWASHAARSLMGSPGDGAAAIVAAFLPEPWPGPGAARYDTGTWLLIRSGTTRTSPRTPPSSPAGLSHFRLACGEEWIRQPTRQL